MTAPITWPQSVRIGSANALSPWPGPSSVSVASPRARNASLQACSSSLQASSPGRMTATGSGEAAMRDGAASRAAARLRTETSDAPPAGPCPAPPPVAAQHRVMRRAVFVRPVGEQVLGVVIVDRGAQEALRRGDAPAELQRLLAELRVLRGFVGPDAAPVVPALDASPSGVRDRSDRRRSRHSAA